MDDAMEKVLAKHQRVEGLTLMLAAARVELRYALREARDAGETVSELARRLGVSRTRVQQLLADVPDAPEAEEP